MELTQSTPSKRYGNLDIIKILSIILVVLTHSIESCIFDVEHSDKLYNFGISLHALTRVAVPMFIMITGFLLLPRNWDRYKLEKFYLKNVFGLILSFQIAITFNFVLKPYLFGGGINGTFLNL